jgi:hypothetical protein
MFGVLDACACFWLSRKGLFKGGDRTGPYCKSNFAKVAYSLVPSISRFD